MSTRRETVGWGPSIPKKKDCRDTDVRKRPLTPKQKTALLFIIQRWRKAICELIEHQNDQRWLWDENESMSRDPDGSVGGVNKPFECHIDTGKYIIMRLLRELAKDAVDAIEKGTYRKGATE